MTVVAFTIALVIACGITWFITQTQATKRLIADRNEKWAAFDEARLAWWNRLSELEAENAKLKSSLLLSAEEKTKLRNEAERAALSGSCADELRDV